MGVLAHGDRRGGVHRLRGDLPGPQLHRQLPGAGHRPQARSRWARTPSRQFSPSLFHYISHLHIAVSGFIAATGLAVLFLVAYGVRRGELWAWVGAVGAPVLGLAVALPAHYPNHFDTLGHLGLIYLATLIFVAGALLALRGIIAQHRG